MLVSLVSPSDQQVFLGNSGTIDRQSIGLTSRITGHSPQAKVRCMRWLAARALRLFEYCVMLRDPFFQEFERLGPFLVVLVNEGVQAEQH